MYCYTRCANARLFPFLLVLLNHRVNSFRSDQASDLGNLVLIERKTIENLSTQFRGFRESVLAAILQTLDGQ
uniref:Putative secreted peptide n=1 Tax=Anopheles braziliensis TaxID=58242 RepID=A0A2M3ZV70_9DIPT